MQRTTVAALILLCGCPPSLPQRGSDVPPVPTAEQARAALTELIRSPEAGALSDFPMWLLNAEIEREADSVSWGPFCLHLRARAFTYTHTFGQPPRVCCWHYRGEFAVRAGRWVALPPQVESQSLGPK